MQKILKKIGKIENCGWLEDLVGTGMIVNSPSPESDEPWGDYSAVISMLKKHPGSVFLYARRQCNLRGDGVLTISGTGEMRDFAYISSEITADTP